MRFTVDSEGVSLETLDHAALAGNRALLLLGLALGRPAAAGGGLLATLQESQRLHWSGAFRADGDAATHSIAFRNGWRTLMRIYCQAEEFPAVLNRVLQLMAEHGTHERVPRHTWSAALYIGRTLWVVLACLPTFFACSLFGLTLLWPYLLMCFAIAMIWLVRGLAWVTLGLCVVILAAASVGAVSPRTSSFQGAIYLRYETLPGDSWALIVLSILGIASMICFASSILRGRVKPALQADEEDAGLG